MKMSEKTTASFHMSSNQSTYLSMDQYAHAQVILSGKPTAVGSLYTSSVKSIYQNTVTYCYSDEWIGFPRKPVTVMCTSRVVSNSRATQMSCKSEKHSHSCTKKVFMILLGFLVICQIRSRNTIKTIRSRLWRHRSASSRGCLINNDLLPVIPC